MSSTLLRNVKRLILAFALISCSFTASVSAQGVIQHALTPADMASVQQYMLTEDSFQKLLATAKDAKANKVQIRILDPNAHSLDETATHLNASPDVRALLSRHSLSAHEFLLGEYALLSAEFAVKYGEQAGFDASMANPANMALYRKHEAEIDALSGDDGNN